MNMYSLLEANCGKITMEQVENSFGGSLCRCTGYRSILDAFKSLATNECGDIEDLALNMCGKCDKECDFTPNTSLDIVEGNDGKMWMRPSNLGELLTILRKPAVDSKYMLVAGNTAHGTIQFFVEISLFGNQFKVVNFRCL